jgi:hypothetical protein
MNFPTIGSVVAYCAKFHGLDAVRAIVTGAKLNSDDLANVTAELQSVGLQKSPSFVNPFDPNSGNGRDWCRRHNQPPNWWSGASLNSSSALCRALSFCRREQRLSLS